MKILGWILLAAGIVMLLVRGIGYNTKEKVADVGPIEINRTEHHTLVWPYYAGGALAVVGLVLVVAAPRRSNS